MSIINSLREFQINKSLTTLELAKLLSVDIDTLAAWFDGEGSPETDERYRILRLIEGGDIEYSIDD